MRGKAWCYEKRMRTDQSFRGSGTEWDETTYRVWNCLVSGVLLVLCVFLVIFCSYPTVSFALGYRGSMVPAAWDGGILESGLLWSQWIRSFLIRENLVVSYWFASCRRCWRWRRLSEVWKGFIDVILTLFPNLILASWYPSQSLAKSP